MSDHGCGGGMGGGDSSSTERSSHTSSTTLLTDPSRQASGKGNEGSTWRTTPILEALARPTQIASPSLAARRLTRWKRIASDDMEKCMEEQEEATSPQESRQNTVEDGGEADTEETPGDSVDSGPAAADKEKGSGVPPLSDSEDDSTRVLMPTKEPYR
ncbi:uncharacterized protein LOC135101822 [Scylla paramamosain]|uniref:uncharacterized protein LOC135101822 n=1 Tax=Scylla paramamosain TaxID=85552 RepID=UPI0030828681